MILITGAAGKTGRSVTAALQARGETVRALVRSEADAADLSVPGAVEAVVGDMRSREDVTRAAEGVRAVYHIPPNMHPDEIALGENAVAAAQAAGVERFVYHSVLHPQVEAMPHHWWKMRVEEMLFESGLAYTVLQPAPYFQNVLPYMNRMRKEGVYGVPYTAEAPLAHVDLADVGEVAAIVLTAPGYENAIFELCGLGSLTPAQIAAAVGAHLGRAVRAEAVPLAKWEAGARAGGLGEYAIQTLAAMFRYYDRHGLPGNPRVLTGLLGRPPRLFNDFLDSVQPLQPSP